MTTQLLNERKCLSKTDSTLEVLVNDEILALRQQLVNLKELFQAAKVSSSSGFEDEKQSSIQQMDSLSEILRQKELLQKENETLKNENLNVLKRLESIQNAKEEAEANLKIAHHHLAKKVKETALLNDTIQCQESKFSELNFSLNSAQTKFQELQDFLHRQSLQEKRIQKELQESCEAAKKTANEWEEKCFRLSQAFSENEKRLSGLIKLEEKYFRLHSLLVSMNHLFQEPVDTQECTSVHSNFVSCDAKVSSSLNVESPVSTIHAKEVYSMKKPYQNLFEMPKQSKEMSCGMNKQDFV